MINAMNSVAKRSLPAFVLLFAVAGCDSTPAPVTEPSTKADASAAPVAKPGAVKSVKTPPPGYGPGAANAPEGAAK